MQPVSGGTCQVDIITMWHALRGTEYDLGVDIHAIQKAEDVFQECMKDYFLPPEATRVNPNIPFFPLPGGALTANTQMLRDNGLMDKYPQIVEAMGETVAKGRKAAIKMLEDNGVAVTEENIFIAASCKEKGILYLTGKSKVNGVRKIDPKEEAAKKAGEYTVKVNGKAYGVKLGKDSATVNGVSYPLNLEFGIDEAAINASAAAPTTAPAAAPTASASAAPAGGQEVSAPMPGLVLRLEVKEGQAVKKNQLVMVMEAMKMENEIYAPCDGTIGRIAVSAGQQLTAGDLLMTIV